MGCLPVSTRHRENGDALSPFAVPRIQLLMTDPELAPAPAAMSDEELARAVLSGRVELFELIMRRNNQRVYRAVRSLLRDEAEVEDAMQQAYVSAFAHLAQFGGGSKLSTWLVRIAINEALGRLRKQKRFVVLEGGEGAEEELESHEPTPEVEVQNREIGAALSKAVDELPEIYRSVFMLREIEGMSSDDAAEALSVTVDVVKTRLHRAKALLQKRLQHLVASHARGTFEFPATRCDRVVAAVMARIK